MGYGEDEPSSSTGLGPSAEHLLSSTEGPSAPLQAQASVMAGSSPAVVPVTSGPVLTVSAQSQPALSVPQDSVPPHSGLLDDLLPTPAPAEPYEDFLARVGRELSTLPRAYHAACRCSPSPCVGDGDDDRNSPSHALPQVRGLILGSPGPGSKPQDSDGSSRLLLHGSSIPLGVARTGLRRGHVFGPCLPACFTAGCPHRTSWTSRTFRRTFPRGPFPCSTSFGSCSWSKNDLFYPPPRAFEDFFWGATHLFIHTTGTTASSSSTSANFATPTMTQQDTGTISQGPTPEMIQGWKKEFMVDMKSFWTQFVGDAPPQQTMGPAVPPVNMGSDSLRQLSPSDDQEASRAPRKAGSKWAGSRVRRHSRSSERSSTDRQRAWVRQHQMSPDSSSWPDACLLPPSAHDGTSVMSPVRPAHQKVVSDPHGHAVLGDLAHHFHAVVVLHLHLHLTAGSGIARLPLVVLSEPAWLGGLLGVHPCCFTGDHLLLIGGHDDHPGAISHPLSLEPGPLIVVHPYRPPGHLHPKDIGPVVCLRAVSVPGPPARSVSLNRMHQTYAFYASAWTMMTSVQTTSIHVIPLHQNNQHLWMTFSCQLRKCRNSLLI